MDHNTWSFLYGQRYSFCSYGYFYALALFYRYNVKNLNKGRYMPKKKSSDRKTIDKVFVLLGTAATVLLIVVGSLAWYGYRFATNMVHDQLSSQKIFFPAAGSAGLPASEFPDLQKYGGKQVVDGEMAKAYADGFIGRHLEAIAGGKTYAEISTAAKADPTNAALQAQKATLFQGETLRGMLLGDGYGFWTFGIIAKWVALASFVAAVAMAVLSLLGYKHYRKIHN